MAMISPQMHLFSWLILMISIIISNGNVRARILVSDKVTGSDRPKGAIKTIECFETGEVIDCVDILKQPSLDDPLLKHHITFLKNHTMQMKTSSNRKSNGTEGAFSQPWWKYGECPEGTIPITRPQKHDMTPDVKRHNPSENANQDHEHAIVSTTGTYKGAHAKINVWSTRVVPNSREASFSQIWLAAGSDAGLNTVETGLMVSSVTDPKFLTRIFGYWTADNYQSTGCYDLKCPGFIQTSHTVSLGAFVTPLSNYGGQQYDLTFDIKRNGFTGRWWLVIGDLEIGYWPHEIFTALQGPATRVDWGGEIVNKKPCGVHTTTEMGSGHFPSEGFGKAAYFSNLKIVDDGNFAKDPDQAHFSMYVTRSECYDLKLNPRDDQIGVSFFYGGPGLSVRCR